MTTAAAPAAHAKNYAPSAAKRWLSCPKSAFISPMYPNDDTDASAKGDYWHEIMEATILFGCVPKNIDPDLDEAMHFLLEYVLRRFEEMGGRGKCTVLVEQRLQIPEINDFGTADIILMSSSEYEIIDLKSGYIAVNAFKNAQMALYLLGVIAKHGERRKYTTTIYQPLYNHIDGPLRSCDFDTNWIEWYRQEIAYALKNTDQILAGKHCKETYCEHRGACETFFAYTRNDLALGWHSSEVSALSDEILAQALDAADELSGYQKALRAEAMRRMLNMDRKIAGYKIVKARKDRAVLNALKLVQSVRNNLGAEWAIKLFPDLSPYLSVEADNIPYTADDPALKFLGTPKHIENIIRLYCAEMKLPRGGWKGVYDTVVGQYIRETQNGLALEKAIDGRPAHTRGGEFGPIVTSPDQNVKSITV